MSNEEKRNQYSGWRYEELLGEACKRSDLTGKEVRMLHKELRKHGDGIPLQYRYPNLKTWIAAGALLLVLYRQFLLGTPR